jgi:O-acetyl-ADP-ribose deacetylase (regulator of RNase III)
MSQAAGIAVREVIKHLKRPDVKLEQVIFVVFDRRAYELYAAQLARYG